MKRYDIHSVARPPVVRGLFCQSCVEDIFEFEDVINIIPYDTDETAGICMRCSRVVHDECCHVHAGVSTIQ